MRKVLPLMIVGLLAGSLSASHAAPLASCGRSAGLSGLPDNASVGGVCEMQFTAAADTPVAVTLVPGDTFTGILTATVTSSSSAYSVFVQGIYAAGKLVSGSDSRSVTLPANAGQWKLRVSAGDTTRMSTPLFPPLPPQVSIPGFAVGQFGAMVSPVTPPPAQ